jgi:hypothetical protein
MEMTDKPFAEDLYLFIANDGQLYRSMAQSIIHAYAVRKIKGTYDPEKAVQGWVNLVEEGLAKYKKKFPGFYKVDKGTKLVVAKALGNRYAEELNERVKKLTALKNAGKSWQRR